MEVHVQRSRRGVELDHFGSSLPTAMATPQTTEISVSLTPGTLDSPPAHVDNSDLCRSHNRDGPLDRHGFHVAYGQS